MLRTLKPLAIKLHDFWMYMCELAFAIQCSLWWALSSLAMRYPSQRPRLLYAHLDPSRGSTTSARCVPRDITPAVLSYYKVDTVLSCFTLQEWLKRFHIRERYVTLIFRRDADIYRARLDLEEDMETYTGKTIFTDLQTMCGEVIHITDKLHSE